MTRPFLRSIERPFGILAALITARADEGGIVYQDFAKDVRLAAAPAAVWGALLDFQRVA